MWQEQRRHTAGRDGFVSVIDTLKQYCYSHNGYCRRYPKGIAVTLDGKKVYVVTTTVMKTIIEHLSVIDTSSDTISATVNIEFSPGGLAIIPDPESVLPVANFSSNISKGFAPLSVQFTDSSENEW